jgi:hypothetical protein
MNSECCYASVTWLIEEARDSSAFVGAVCCSTLVNGEEKNLYPQINEERLKP